MTAPIDIRPVDLAIVQDILRAVLPATAKVYVFGSRALWTTKDGSDLDLAIDAGRKLTREESLDLADAFEESDLPYKVDVVDLHDVSEGFRAIVERDKVVLDSRVLKTIPLSETTKFIVDNRGKTAPTASSGIALIATNCISNGDLYPTYKNVRYVSSETLRDWFRANPEPGDIILTLKGSQNGAVCLVPEIVDFAIAQDMVALRANEDVIDPLFLFAALRSRPVQEQIRNLDVSGVIPHLKKGDFDKLQLPYPDRKTQKFIGEIYFALCNKIELNRAMNETLQAMARAIFKDWFVDFGPTRAKIEGQAPYLPPEIWSLFPDTLDDEGKPEGWRASTIGQEVVILGGSTPSTKEAAYWGGDFFWATPKDLSSLSNPVLLGTERKISKAGLSQIGSALLPIGTVLLSSRAPIGYMAIAQVPVAVNQGFIAMICKKKLSNVFVWQWTHANMETVHQNANGSTFQEISKSNFKPIPVTVATPDTLKAFDEMIVPLFEKIVANEIDSRSLAATRDFLLPKLMSGEVRVKDAELMIGALP